MIHIDDGVIAPWTGCDRNIIFFVPKIFDLIFAYMHQVLMGV
jgi:hypothetical protein